MANITIVDDDRMLCEMLVRYLTNSGHHVSYALTLEKGLKKGASENPDLVLLDVHLPDGDGLSALAKFHDLPSSPEVIIFTGEGDFDGAELAIKSGAWDYIEKPPSLKDLMLPLSRALQYRREKRDVKPRLALDTEGIAGSGPRMKACFDLLAQAASSETNVLIIGETGTGKELFAKAIHENSGRSRQNFVVVDCTALPETLVETILLGHEKGAFTGADRAHVGLIRQASGGTLFLDEVGELPTALQKPFLRVVQERRFRPIGGRRELTSDFRLIAATNRNLENMVKSGRFREDLFYRLKTSVIELPALRDHREDIREIILYHMTKICDRYQMEAKGFAPGFLETLEAYHWPGNVRELVHALERALAAARHDPTLFPKHLPDHIRIHMARQSLRRGAFGLKQVSRGSNASEPLPPLQVMREKAILEVENGYLQELMALSKGNIKEACRISGLSRARLYALLQKHNISRRNPYWTTQANASLTSISSPVQD